MAILRQIKKHSISTIIFLILTSGVNAQIDNKYILVDSYIDHIIQRQGIPGVALAIIKDGRVVHKKNYGYANLEHQVPVTHDSIFRLYSLTKPIISVAIFQLIEQKQLTLDDTVSTYVDDLPQTWKNIQIKHLLTHSSGLEDMWFLLNRKDMTEDEAKHNVFKKDLKFQAGNKFDYNQTNFWLLQKVIEKIAQTSLSQFVIENQFKSSSDTVFFSSDSRDIIKNRATPYFYFSKGKLTLDHSYMQGDYGNAMTGLNVKLDDFIEWDRKFSQGLLLKKETQQLMLESFNYTSSDKVFAYSWDKFKTNGILSYGFTGSLVTAYRTFPDKNLSIVLLSNGLSYWYNIDNIVNYIASLVDPIISDTNNSIYEKLLQASIQKSFNDFKEVYSDITRHYQHQNINFEQQINDVGYMLLNIKDFDTAINVFELNVSSFPKSWNVYDSLGEAYEKNKSFKQSLMNYRKALALNTTNSQQRNSQLEEKILYLEKQLE